MASPYELAAQMDRKLHEAHMLSHDLAAALSPDAEIRATVPALREDQIKHMVNRFLNWNLPKDFSPDGGISFQKVRNQGTPYAGPNTPSGTNLLDGQQADAMVRHMLEGMPE